MPSILYSKNCANPVLIGEVRGYALLSTSNAARICKVAMRSLCWNRRIIDRRMQPAVLDIRRDSPLDE
jgi:hypothetical protein